MPWAFAAALSLLLCGCGLERGGLAGPDGAGRDAGGTDGSVGGSDATAPDGGDDAEVPGEDAGPLDGGPGDAGCDASWNACTGGTEAICDPGTGMLVTRTCPLGCSPTEPRCARLVPSNVPASLVDSEAADLTVSSDTTWDTTSCDGAGMSLELGSSDYQLCVLTTGAFEVSATLRVQGKHPLVVLAAGAIDVSGTIDVSAYGQTTGPGGFPGGVASHRDGYGPHPGLRGAHVGSYDDGGGGGGGMCGTGGAGGQGDDASGGAGGGGVGASWELQPIHGGSGGGVGPGAAGSDFDNRGYGGAGGGALQLTSLVSITVSGRILAGGGGGDPGGRTGSSFANYGAGGGGGAGGAVLIEAPTVAFPGSGTVIATGGGGGGSGSEEGDGQPGQDGAETADRASGGDRGGSEHGARGGDSGGGTTPDGVMGDSTSNSNGNGGGGGGAAGCVLVRNHGGTLPGGTDRFSPRVAPALRALSVRVE